MSLAADLLDYCLALFTFYVYGVIIVQCYHVTVHKQVKWEESTISLKRLNDDLQQGWANLSKIAQSRPLPNCEDELKAAAERLEKLKLVNRRVTNRIGRFYKFLGVCFKQQKVTTI